MLTIAQAVNDSILDEMDSEHSLLDPASRALMAARFAQVCVRVGVGVGYISFTTRAVSR